MGEGLSPGDPNSFSNSGDVCVTHLHLTWNIDFDKKIIDGKVNLKVLRKGHCAKKLVLDTSELNISYVKDGTNGYKLDYKLYGAVPNFGSKLEINLPSSPDEMFDVVIGYKTSPKASALQWLEPEQTAGKKFPYMFSQCQAIHCRSIIPCQDSPASKVTYSAEVTVPEELTVLMSAVRQVKQEKPGSDIRKYRFEQKVPIPTYLIAIAVGHLESRRIGPRSHVWCEKEFINQSAEEFSETEKMLSTAEGLCGKYVWEVYDLLVLPPSFPYGGMENPCLTFVTPTLLAGDKSLADVIAHEIAHSWTGNLITNRNFEHFWLNEGFTMFVERKILGRMYGSDARLFSACRGLKDLNDTIKTLGVTNPLTQLVVDLKNVSPDDAFSTVPYEKGHTFLYYLEELVGGPDNFDPFLKAYLEEFQYKSIDTADFRKYFYEYFGSDPKYVEIDWDTWLFSPGMPPVIPNYKSPLEDDCIQLKNKWVTWNEHDAEKTFSKSDIEKLISPQIQEFLSLLLLEKPLSITKLQAMEKVYEFNSNKNSEVRFRWLRLCIKGEWSDQIPLVLKFVTEQGRMKFVRPLYRDLAAWKVAKSKAIETFKAQKSKMMYVAAYVVAKDLGLK